MMFTQRDVLVYEEMAKDRRRQREQMRLLATTQEPARRHKQSRRPAAPFSLRTLLQKLLPAA